MQAGHCEACDRHLVDRDPVCHAAGDPVDRRIVFPCAQRARAECVLVEVQLVSEATPGNLANSGEGLIAYTKTS
jgi:hypothetical protein